MGIWDRWKLGAKALALATAVRDALRHIDGAALLEAVMTTVANERRDPTPGNGAAKWAVLRDWFVAGWPQYADRIDSLAAVVRALVALMNATGLFRSRVNGGATNTEPRA